MCYEIKEKSRSDISERCADDFIIFPMTTNMDIKHTKNPRSFENFILENNSLTFERMCQKVVP